MSNVASYPLRLPRSIKTAVEKLAAREEISMNQFIATAVAEKLAVLNTVSYFEERKSRADLVAIKKILQRKGGEDPNATLEDLLIDAVDTPIELTSA
jgi:hypothetical protein